MDSLVGKCIDDKYEIKELLASGGMGEVYLAEQKGTGQIVAIKKLKREYYQDSIVVERFVNEARLYGQVTHPNAVKLHDVLNIDGQICIVMEYVAGKTLASMLKAGYVFTTRQIVDIAIQIADALATLHKAGIIHRDLKTDNIMLIETVSRRFSVKILDFGIAKFKDGQSNSITQQGVIVGTPEFMSPEQCYGMPVDLRADIYSFGILLFVMICGHLPFEAPSALALLHKQANEPLPEMKRPDSSNVPLGLEGIVRKCAMKKAEDRYQSFVDVITDLTCLQEGRKTSIELTPIDYSQKDGKQRKPLLVICTIALIFAVAGVTSFLLMRGTDNNIPVVTAETPPAADQTMPLAPAQQALGTQIESKDNQTAHAQSADTASPQAPETQKDDTIDVAAASPQAPETQKDAAPKEVAAAPSMNEPKKPDPSKKTSSKSSGSQNAAPKTSTQESKKVEPAQAAQNTPKPEETKSESKPAAPAPAQAAHTEPASNTQKPSRIYDSSIDLANLDIVMAPSNTAKQQPSPSILKVGSKPPCTVIINNKEYGQTPKKIELPAGKYEITCKVDNKVLSKTVMLPSGEPVTVRFP